MSRLSRRLHRLHRALGSALCALLFVWFASGAVMTVAGFPRYTERERLHDAEPLPPGLVPQVPVQLASWIEQGGLGRGELRLVSVQGKARWQRAEAGRRAGFMAETGLVSPLARAAARFAAPRLSQHDARAIAERVLSAPLTRVTWLSAPDQWTVPLGSTRFPLWRVEAGDAAHSELYLSVDHAEIVQRTTESERVMAWLGAIPHWVYPTLLRQQRALWKWTVISLASVALVLTLSGLWAGIDMQRRMARRSPARSVRDPALRWHQRIGLGFGALVASWLFSGILSFTPFDWTGDGVYEQQLPARLAGAFPKAALAQIGAALARCQSVLPVRELALQSLAGVPLLLCLGADGDSRLVRLDQAELTPRPQLDAPLASLAVSALTPRGAKAATERLEHADLYYYPTHAEPDLPLPVLRVALADAEHHTFYLDLQRATLALSHSDRTRLERWLFHGLHSWDLALLYRHPALWRGCVWAAMLLGAALSALGTFMALRRRQRGRRHEARRREA